LKADLLNRLAGKARGLFQNEARWLLADFRVPASGWRKWRARVILSLMYAFFRFATGLPASRLTSADDFLQATGFRLAGRRLANFGLAHSDLWLRSKR
jgi:hypothetical protein